MEKLHWWKLKEEEIEDKCVVVKNSNTPSLDADAWRIMTAAPGPSGILAGRPSGCQSQLQNGTATKASNNKKVAVLESGRCREKEDLVTRTSVIDAKVAIQQIKRVS